MSDLEAIEKIRRLKARYFRTMDTKQWEELAAVFTDDVVIDMTGEGAGITTSVAAYLPFLIEQIGDVITVHHGHMSEIHVDDADHARGIWAMEDELWWPEGSPLKHLHGYGHYHESYRRTEDGWRISAMTLTRLHRIIEFS